MGLQWWSSSGIVLAMLRNAQMSMTFLQGGHVQIFTTFESSGIWPSEVHSWPRIITSGAARKSLGADTVALVCPRQ